MPKTEIKLKCPKCGFPSEASLKRKHDIILYICPKCLSNVVLYNNKIDTISDRLLAKLVVENKLKSCGDITNISVNVEPKKETLPPKDLISSDDLTNLKIVLESSASVDDFIKNI